jgi:hypothetical protein
MERKFVILYLLYQKWHWSALLFSKQKKAQEAHFVNQMAGNYTEHTGSA